MKTDSNFLSTMMTMNDEVWSRHANPMSVWSRVITGLPVLLGSIWLIREIAWWSILVIVAALLWLWLNPRLFKAPKNTNNWSSKVTFGERIWLNRQRITIPKHHRVWANTLSWISGLGFLLAVFASVQQQLSLMIIGGIVSWFAKMWFCDRMVWLYEDMKNKNATYLSWLKE